MRGGWKNLLVQASWTLLAALAICNSGCLLGAVGAAAGGAAAYYYLDAPETQVFPADYGDVQKAVVASLHDLNLPLEHEEHQDDVKGTIESRAADGTVVTIKLTSVPSKAPGDKNVTKVCVRVGCWGDRDFSFRILDQIGGHLAYAVPVVPGGPLVPIAVPVPPGPSGVVPAGWQPQGPQPPNTTNVSPPPAAVPPQSAEPPRAKP